MYAHSAADDVKLYFFGAPLIERSGSSVPVDRQKAIALLAYLVLTGRRHHRDVLAALLWPELDQTRARAGLRRVLDTLRGAIGGDRVLADRESVGLRWPDSLWADVAAFQQRLADSRLHGAQRGIDPSGQLLLEEAVALYRADLLTGFNLRDAPEFENWLCLERETLRRAVTSALELLVQLHAAHGSYGPALDFAQRWLALEPEEERAHQALIALYLRNNDSLAAHRQYELCKRVLAEELGVPPSAETQLLIGGSQRSVVSSAAPVAAQMGVSAGGLPVGAMRLATVLVTGLEPLADADDTFGAASELAIQRQDRFVQVAQEILHGYGAYVAPNLGDKTLAVFGIPVSHEDDPERAVRAALDLQRTVAPDAQAATGVHTGMIYLQGGSAAPAQEVVILGSAVDTVLRLYTSAPAGEILVTPATQRLTSGVVEYTTCSATVAGTRTPATIFRAERLQELPRKVRGVPGLSAPLVGRGPELAQLLATVQGMRAAGEGRFVLLSGSAGVGKSRLVAELHDRLTVANGADLTWLEGRCLELMSDTACGPFRGILRAFADFAPDADSETRAQRFVVQLATLWRQAAQPAAQLAEVTAFLANLLSLRLPAGYLSMGRLAPEEAHFRTVAALVSFAVALAKRKPTVLVLEDLHWADAHSLRVVERLAASLPTAPLAVVCVLRPEADRLLTLRKAARASPAPMLELQLAELTEQESRLLVEQLLTRSPLPAELESLTLERAEGNPFFLEETLRTLIDDGILVRQGEVWGIDAARLQRAQGTTPERVPAAVQSILLSRIDRQPVHLRKLLQTAAVIGREAPLALLSRLLPAGTKLAAMLAALEQDGLLVPDPAQPGTQVIFRHALQQVAAYQTIGSGERRALHGQVAQAIEALWPAQQDEHVEQLAYHYSRSDEVEKAVAYLGKAGERARELFLNSTASGFFAHALALHGQLPAPAARRSSRAMILASLGQVQHTAGDHLAAAESLQQAFDEGLAAGWPTPMLARWAYWLADARYWCLDNQGVLDACARAFAVLPIEPDSLEAVLLNQQMAGAYAAFGDAERFYVISLQTAQVIRRLPFCEELTSPYHHVIDACLARKEVARAWEFIEALHGQAQAVGNLRALAKAKFIAARTCSETGRLAEALARGEAALALAQQAGDAAIIDFCLGRLMSDALALGNFEAAERYAALEHRVAMDAGALGAEALMLVGRTQLGLGHAQAACDLLEQSIALSDEAGYPIAPEANLWLGRAYQRLGDKAHAINQFQIVLQRSRPTMPSPPYMPDAKPVFALALAALDEVLANRAEFSAVWRPLLDGSWRAAPLFTHPELVPATTLDHGQSPITSIDPADPRWRWEDPEGDCSWKTGAGYVEIFAANGRDVWWTNFSAPRVVRTFDGDFSLQVRCEPADDQTPAIGGLLLWLDERNYLRLDRGSGGAHELVFMGCIGSESAVIGRGRLPTAAVELRLDRKGADVTATCRGDGGGWLTLGRADFPAGPVAAGLFVVGLVERTLYQAVELAGARVRFRL